MTTRVQKWLGVGASIVFSQVVVYVILRPPAGPGIGSRWEAFRGFFVQDQLGYAAYAGNVAKGVSGYVEPFTETGQSYYPTLWYAVLGNFARWSGLSIPAVWTIAGWLVLAFAVALLGLLGVVLSGRAWAPALVGPLLAVGTLSEIVNGHWYTTFDSYTTVWGPFGTLFVLNAETVGVSFEAIALGLGLFVLMNHSISTRVRLSLLTIAGFLLGILAGIHTYSFFVGVGFVAAWIAAWGLIESRNRIAAITTGVLVVALFVVGPIAASQVGGLPVFGLLLVAAIPGAMTLPRRQKALLLLPAAVFAVACLPQVILILRGVMSDDPFLAFRQAASEQLGIPVLGFVIASLPVAALWVFNLVVALKRRCPAIVALLGAMGVAWTLLSFNGSWGFGQEPFRHWVNGLAVGLLVLAPVTAWSVGLRAGIRDVWSDLWVKAAAVLCALLLGLSMIDFGSFRAFAGQSGLVRFDSARNTALRELTAGTDGLLAYGPCIDPRELKVASGKRVAFFNRQMAWPSGKAKIEKVMKAWAENRLDTKALIGAGVRYLVVDDGCSSGWNVSDSPELLLVGSETYSGDSPGSFSLWRVRGM